MYFQEITDEWSSNELTTDSATDMVLKCRVCYMTFNWPSSRTRHEFRAHNFKAQRPLDALEEHYSRMHDVPTWKCERCSKEFPCEDKLTRHVLLKHSTENQYLYRNIRCYMCGKSFPCNRALKGHLANKHGAAKEFKCNFCGKEFGYKHDMMKHIKSQHSEDSVT